MNVFRYVSLPMGSKTKMYKVEVVLAPITLISSFCIKILKKITIKKICFHCFVQNSSSFMLFVSDTFTCKSIYANLIEASDLNEVLIFIEIFLLCEEIRL